MIFYCHHFIPRTLFQWESQIFTENSVAGTLFLCGLLSFGIMFWTLLHCAVQLYTTWHQPGRSLSTKPLTLLDGWMMSMMKENSHWLTRTLLTRGSWEKYWRQSQKDWNETSIFTELIMQTNAKPRVANPQAKEDSIAKPKALKTSWWNLKLYIHNLLPLWWLLKGQYGSFRCPEIWNFWLK